MDREVITEFPQLDFTALLNPDHDFAVHCSSDAQALHFLREVRRQYPKNAWTHEETRWHSDSPIAYSPYLNRGKHMTWDSLSHYTNRNFVIVEFEDLCPNETDIEESELSMDALFGGIV